MDALVGRFSYHAVYDNPSYDLNNLGKWANLSEADTFKKVFETYSIEKTFVL